MSHDPCNWVTRQTDRQTDWGPEGLGPARHCGDSMWSHIGHNTVLLPAFVFFVVCWSFNLDSKQHNATILNSFQQRGLCSLLPKSTKCQQGQWLGRMCPLRPRHLQSRFLTGLSNSAGIRTSINADASVAVCVLQLLRQKQLYTDNSSTLQTPQNLLANIIFPILLWLFILCAPEDK